MLLIFDFDGTLADTFWVVINTYNSMAPKYGAKTVAPGDIAKMQGMSYWKGFKQLGIKWYTLPLMLREGRLRVKKVIHEAPPYPGLVDTLQELKEAGAEYGIVTSNNPNVVRAYLRDNDFPTCDFIKGNQGLFTKHRAIKKMAKAHLLKGEAVYYIGDEPRDIEAAKKAGVQSAAAAWGFASAERLKKDGPDLLLSKPEELVGLLNRG
jgi:phosphoglycolate phosphatase